MKSYNYLKVKIIAKKKCFKLQNRAARILMRANYASNMDELFRAQGWRKLKYQKLEEAAVMMYKS